MSTEQIIRSINPEDFWKGIAACREGYWLAMARVGFNPPAGSRQQP